MHITETIPSDWNHSNGGVQLHSARSERNHSVSKSSILVCKSLNISHHVSLGELHSEDVLVHVLIGSLQIVSNWNILATFVIFESREIALSLSFLKGSKNIDDLVHIINGCRLIEGNTDVVIVDFSQIDSMLVELGKDKIR